MNREGFIGELRQRLSGLPQEEIEERLSFFVPQTSVCVNAGKRPGSSALYLFQVREP